MTANNASTDLKGPIVVFGGAGFIGTHLLERLRADGASRLVSIDIKPPARPVADVDYRIGDVRDLSSLSFEDSVTALYNLSAILTTPGHEPWEYYDTNVRGAVEICRFARRHQTRLIVFTSSMSVYGRDEAPKHETTPPTPTNDYGRSKVMAEMIHRDWLSEASDRRLVVSRPAVVFGLGEGGNFTRLARMLAKGWFFYPGRRDTIKSCIAVEDLVDWTLAAVNRENRFILFNGAFSDRYTIEEIVETFKAVAFPNARTVTLPATLLKSLAAALSLFSATGLGMHPERVEKLMVSTNIMPDWAEAQRLPTTNRLKPGLERWQQRGNGAFL